MKNIIKKHLDDFAEKDENFKTKYDVEMLGYCIQYIMDKAKEMAKDEDSIAIESDTVFKWARDYFNDGIAIKEKEESVKKAAEAKTAKEKFEAEQKEREARWAEQKKEQEKKDFMDAQHKGGQISMFDFAAFSKEG